MKTLTPDQTWKALENGPLYMNFDRDVPLLVWVLADRGGFSAKVAVKTVPAEILSGVTGRPLGLVWALVEATSVSRSGTGISVGYCRSGAGGWYPRGNALLPAAEEVGR